MLVINRNFCLPVILNWPPHMQCLVCILLRPELNKCISTALCPLEAELSLTSAGVSYERDYVKSIFSKTDPFYSLQYLILLKKTNKQTHIMHAQTVAVRSIQVSKAKFLHSGWWECCCVYKTLWNLLFKKTHSDTEASTWFLLSGPPCLIFLVTYHF